jgi:hypothetical protein
MIAQRAEIDAQKRNAEQKKDRFSDMGLEPLAERRHGDADEHQRGNRARSLAAEPRQRTHWKGDDPL